MKRSTPTLILVGLAPPLFCLSPAMSQSGRGTLTGTVKDASGAIVPGAEVLITNMGTGGELKAVTTSAGVYRVPYIPPGKYRVSATSPGFKKSVRENVEIHVAETVEVDILLEIGQLTDSVTVTGAAPTLERASAELGIASTEKEVHTWPIQVDDGTGQLQSFIFSSMPGTQGDGWEGSINGSQAFSHEVLIDGISVGRI